MDPLTALGLAANILQFVDYGIKVVKQTKLMLESGTTPEDEYLDSIAQDLMTVVEDLTKQGVAEDPPRGIEESTRSFFVLARQCQDEAQTLINKVNTYKPRRREGFAGRFSTFRKVVKSSWDKPEVEALERRLNGYRSQLSIRMLAALNAKTDKHGADIVEILSLTRTVDASIQAVGAILKNSDGAVRTILGDSFHPQNESVKTETVVYARAPRNPTPDFVGVIPSQIAFEDVTKKILNSLWFRQVFSRERGIEEAYSDTYQWVFEDELEQCGWSNFASWLQHDSGCYWIHGRAGSGKSTLMKYIANHPELRRNLQLWTGDDDLIISTFFFWRGGQDLQRTQEGLLKSLLHQVLVRRQELVAVCFPELCQALGQNEMLGQSPLVSFDDLKLAFSRLLKQDIPKTKLFFLIDGLDEYRGDLRNLAELVLQATHSNTTKVLISSRYLSPLVQAFGAFPALRLQDLTINDIRHYTADHLASDNTLKEKESGNPGISKQLIESIVEKANGVFLWVVLVVRKVLTGLANYDYESSDDLLSALEGLPSELEELYDHMFKSMTTTYREEASLMMQLYIRSEQVQFHYPMTALQLALAIAKDALACLDDKSNVLTGLEKEDKNKHIEGRLRSRWCGLLEVQRSTWSPSGQKVYVGFLHRTVMDFFENEKIWKQLTSWNEIADDALDELLLCSCIQEIRQDLPDMSKQSLQRNHSNDVRKLRRSDTVSAPDVGTRVLHGLVYSWSLRTRDGPRQHLFTEELWKLYHSMPLHEKRNIDQWAQHNIRTQSLDGSSSGNVPPVITYAQPFLLYAASYGLGEFSGVHLKDSSASPQEQSVMLLNVLVNLNAPPEDRSAEQLAAGALGLLKHGVNPNAPALFYPAIETANESEEIKTAIRLSPNQENDLIPWIYWLSSKRREAYLVRHHPELYGEILEQMMVAGAPIRGHLGKNKIGKNDSIVAVVENCLETLQQCPKDTRELQNRIHIHIKKAGLTRSKTAFDIGLKSESSRLSWLKIRKRNSLK